mgnify:CR=1 FL=1
MKLSWCYKNYKIGRETLNENHVSISIRMLTMLYTVDHICVIALHVIFGEWYALSY